MHDTIRVHEFERLEDACDNKSGLRFIEFFLFIAQVVLQRPSRIILARQVELSLILKCICHVDCKRVHQLWHECLFIKHSFDASTFEYFCFVAHFHHHFDHSWEFLSEPYLAELWPCDQFFEHEVRFVYFIRVYAEGEDFIILAAGPQEKISVWVH